MISKGSARPKLCYFCALPNDSLENGIHIRALDPAVQRIQSVDKLSGLVQKYLQRFGPFPRILKHCCIVLNSCLQSWTWVSDMRRRVYPARSNSTKYPPFA